MGCGLAAGSGEELTIIWPRSSLPHLSTESLSGPRKRALSKKPATHSSLCEGCTQLLGYLRLNWPFVLVKAVQLAMGSTLLDFFCGELWASLEAEFKVSLVFWLAW